MKIVSLGAYAPLANGVSGIRGRVPRWRERDVTADEIRSGQHLDPREAVGVGPYRVVDSREVDVKLRAAVFQEVRQQKRHLVHREWILARPRRFVPHLRMRRRVDWARHKIG